MNVPWNFSVAGEILFGQQSLNRLGTLCKRHRWHRALVISDENLLAADLVDRACAILQSECVDAFAFAETEREPAIETAEEAVSVSASFGADVVIGLGGGSNMDLAKVVSTVLACGGSPRDYFDFDCIPRPILPLICIPTTAGTGSEVSRDNPT